MKIIIVILLIFCQCIFSYSQKTIAEEYKEKGTKLAKEGRYEEAIENLNRAIQIDPDFAAAYNNRGIVKMQLEKYQDAITDFNRAIEINSKDPAYYINRGMTHEKMNMYHEAIIDYKQAIELDPFKPDYYIKKGFLENELKNYKNAIEDYNMAIKIAPSEPDYYYYRGLAKLSSENFYNGHQDFFKAAQMGHFKSKNMIVEVFFNTIPDDEEFALSVRSSMKLHIKDYEGAIKDLDELIKISPKKGKYFLNKGVANIHLENRKDACRDFKKALNLGEYDAKIEFDKYCE